MAASLRSNMVVVMATAVAATMLLTVSGAHEVPKVGNCPADGVLVYPYWSWCWNPAVYYGQEVYEFAAAAASGNVSGSLAPEYDESNATYYMRLADVGAKYFLTHLTMEFRFYVTQTDSIMFVNVDTGRALAWREEGEDEFFLVEISGYSTDLAALQFAAAANVSLPCIKHLDARCEAYTMVTVGNSSIGVNAYEEDGATYFNKGPLDTALPFVLRRSTDSVSVTKSVQQQLAAPA